MQVLLKVVEVVFGESVSPDEIAGFAVDYFYCEWVESVVTILPVQGLLSPTGKGEALPASRADGYTTAEMKKRRRCCIAFCDTGNDLRFAVCLVILLVFGCFFLRLRNSRMVPDPSLRADRWPL